MPESTYIADASFTKYIGVLKKFPFSLADSFRCGIYMPWDKSTLFKDAGMTSPVTADGDAVEVMKDMSGNGNHFTKLGAAPIYKEVGGIGRLRFDGAAQGMRLTGTGLQIFPGSAYGLVVACFDTASAANNKHLLRINNNSNTELLSFYTQYASGVSRLRLNSKRLAADTVVYGDYATGPSQPEIYSADMRFADAVYKTYKNGGGEQTLAYASAGTTDPAVTNGTFLGQYNSTTYAAMDFFGAVLAAGATAMASNRADIEAWLAARPMLS